MLIYNFDIRENVILTNRTSQSTAFADAIPIPEWYKVYSMEGISKVDSDFEMDSSEADEADRLI